MVERGVSRYAGERHRSPQVRRFQEVATVFLIEPNRTQFDLHFRLFGFPVRVHPFFWLFSAFFGSGLRDPKLVLIWVAASFVSILVHELGHAVVIRYFGWRPSITLYGMGGFASYQPTHQDPRKQILIALAGPGAGFLLALAVVLFVAALGGEVDFSVGWPYLVSASAISEKLPLFVNFFDYFVLRLCVWWGLINLLPIIPLDGGHVCRELFRLDRPWSDSLIPYQISMFTAGAMAAYGIYLDSIFFAMFFGMMAVDNYRMTMHLSGRGGFGRW